MKKILVFAAIFISVTSAVCFADFNVSKWKYYKDILGAGEGLLRLTLDDEVFSNSSKDLSDLRIIGENNREVPFKLISGRQQFQKEQIPVKMINNSFIPGKNSQVILDLGGNGEIANNLVINTSSENFQRNVKVFGSNNMESWSILKDNGYIYDFTDKKANFKAQNTDILFPDSAFHYIKIEIADESSNPIKINSVSTNKVINEKKREYKRVPKIESSENSEKKLTEIVVDIGASGIPTDKILIDSKSVNFNRAVLVYSGNEKKENGWTYLGQGYIFRYNTPKFMGENMEVNFPETNKRFIKVEIINKDDSPIEISSLNTFSFYQEVVFQSNKSESYKLFYGNQKADYPQYDLDKYFEYLEPKKAINAEISSQKNNFGYIPEKEPEKPLSERIPYMMSGILTLASLGLIFLVYKFLKK